MPTTEYESRTDSVLAWKKAQKLGRFDPNAGSIEEQKIRAFEREIEERGKTLRVLMLPMCESGYWCRSNHIKTDTAPGQRNSRGGSFLLQLYIAISPDQMANSLHAFLIRTVSYLACSLLLPRLPRPHGERVRTFLSWQSFQTSGYLHGRPSTTGGDEDNTGPVPSA
jgi:hypothetical protein